MSFTPSPNYKLVLNRLVAAREESGTTIEELARILQLTPAQVESFESGKVRLDFAQTRQWCLALGLSFERFVLHVAQDIDALYAQNEARLHPPGSDDVETPTPDSEQGDAP